MASIHEQGFDRAWGSSEISMLMQGAGVFSLIAKTIGKPDNPPVGFIMIRMAADEAEILSIAVNKSSRRRSVGQQLMAETIRRLQSERTKTLFLEVAATNSAAIGLYNVLKFKTISERQNYYSRPDENNAAALVMRLDLD